MWAPDVPRPARLNWVWTVVDPASAAREPDAAQARSAALNLVVPHDPIEGHQEAGWRASTVSRVLGEWSERFAARADVPFVYDPDLLSDMVRDLADVPDV